MNESFAKVRNINKVLRSMMDIFRREQKFYPIQARIM